MRVEIVYSPWYPKRPDILFVDAFPVQPADKRLPLDAPPMQRNMLDFLLMRAGKIVTFEQMIGHLYGDDPDGGPLAVINCMKVYISHLTKKLPKGMHIKSVYGRGWTLKTDEPLTLILRRNNRHSNEKFTNDSEVMVRSKDEVRPDIRLSGL